jgi:hypothetical protein
VEQLDNAKFRDAARLAPFREAAHGIQVRLAHVIVADLRGEEFDAVLRAMGVGAKHGGCSKNSTTVLLHRFMPTSALVESAKTQHYQRAQNDAQFLLRPNRVFWLSFSG